MAPLRPLGMAMNCQGAMLDTVTLQEEKECGGGLCKFISLLSHIFTTYLVWLAKKEIENFCKNPSWEFSENIQIRCDKLLTNAHLRRQDV